MKYSSTILVAALAGVLAAPTFAQREAVRVGSTPEYTFRDSPVNGMGLSQLAELRGKPVLVEFWGTR